jgi:type I restriction enzyme S subunit
MRWPKATLGECATLVNGRAYKQEELLDTGTPVLRIQNLNGGDRWYYSDLSLPQDKYCDKGDLLFAWSASFGPYLWNGPRAIYHYHIWKVLPGRLLDKGFLYHLLGFLTARVKSESHGASMLHMTKARMEALEIPLPPLEEQRRIAAILDKAAALQSLTNKAHQIIADVRVSRLRDLLCGATAHQSAWECVPISRLIRGTPNNGIFRKNHEYDDPTFQGLPVIWVEQLFRGEVVNPIGCRLLNASKDEIKKYGLLNGDILFCRSSLKPEGIAKANIYIGEDNQALFECHIIRISPDRSKVNPIFLNECLNLP